MKKQTVLVVLFLGAFLFSSWADGNESLYDLTSPAFLAGGWDYTSTLSPQADTINPAASALNQRVTLDLSYIGIGFDENIPGWKGLNLNSGVTVPTKAGVLSLAMAFRHSPAWENLHLGTQFTFNGSFAKELYDGVLLGIGINASVGNGYAATADLGLIHMKGDVGILKDFRWALVLQEFGYVDKNADYPSPFSLGLGMGFTPVRRKAFTMDVAASLNIPTFQNARLALGTELTFWDRVGLQGAVRLDVKEILAGDYSGCIPSFGLVYNHRLSLSAEKLSQGQQNQGWNQSEIRVNAGAAPLGGGLWAIGGGVNVPLGVIDNKPPEINIDTGGFRFYENPPEVQEPSPAEEPAGGAADGLQANAGGPDTAFSKPTGKEKTSAPVSFVPDKGGKAVKNFRAVQESPEAHKIPVPEKGIVAPEDYPSVPVVEYISPNNDGLYDSLTFPVSITDTRYIQGFALIIQDARGNVVRKIENKDERPENRGFTGFFKRLFSVKKGISIPESLRWDGLFDDGSLAPDGKYVFYLQAWDDNGNTGNSRPLGVVVDNTPPELIITPPKGSDLIFSPDGDGNKDSLFIGLSGSREDLWALSIRNSQGRTVRTVEWRDQAMGDFVWDGRDDGGVTVPDDVYHVYVTSTDRGGNTTFGGFENIIINTIPTPVGLSISGRYFSPGRQDAISQVEIIFSVPVKTGIQSWRLEILGRDRVYRTFQGAAGTAGAAGAIPPDSVLFDGRTDSGSTIPEGTYRARLVIQYENGNRPEAVSPEFIADITAPSAAVSLSYDSFSPNGDGLKDTIRFYIETSLEEQWSGEIRDSRGGTVMSYSWRDRPPAMLDWDGLTAEGKLAPDGEYGFTVFAVDRAGNRGQSTPVYFDLDTEDTTVFLSTDKEAFSPNGDGRKDTMTFVPDLKVPEGIERYTLRVENQDGAVVWEFSGTGRIARNPVWDGFGRDGRRVPDGNYRGRLEVVYEKGDISQAASRWIVLDTVFPTAEVTAEYALFSPDGDGFKDTLPITQATSREDLWTGLIKDSSGKTVREYYWQGQGGNFQWDGKDGDGNALPDGRYAYTLAAEDKAGNSTVTTPLAITLDSSPRAAYITAEKDGFAPTGNGVHDDIKFNILIPNTAGISRWEVAIESYTAAGTDSAAGGRTVRTFTAEVIPQSIVWDGKDDRGQIAADGNYRAKLTVEYLKGNRPISFTSPFVVDTKAPAMDLRLSPLPFSPDNDGVDDELHILPRLSDMTGVASWSMEIYDRTGALFKTFKGAGAPSEEIIWDGRGDRGDLVISAEDYTYAFQASDKWGNTAGTTGKIPVDVLVIREGNRLRIQIASIQFAPDSPSLSEESQEIIDRNVSVLRRLGEILKKYDSYSITIEGHAASVYWQNPARAAIEERDELQPLSKARAETVKNYLVQMGISPNRISTVGRGGTEPAVPHSDVEGRWKNRRVDFLLDR